MVWEGPRAVVIRASSSVAVRSGEFFLLLVGGVVGMRATRREGLVGGEGGLRRRDARCLE